MIINIRSQKLALLPAQHVKRLLSVLMHLMLKLRKQKQISKLVFKKLKIS